MRDDDLAGDGRGLLWRLVGAVISVTLVSKYIKYIVLVAAMLAVRVPFGLAAEAWRRLLAPRERPCDVTTPGAEAA